MISITLALPKGRLGEKALCLLERAGITPAPKDNHSRKLVFDDERSGVRIFWVKPSDVAIYVERGTADIGIAGKDILLEYSPDMYELMDLEIGRCKMCVAAKQGFKYDSGKTLSVATKFPNIATRYYESRSKKIDIIKLNGSIELAPILGLSDVIVDIVETGDTIRQNDLSVIEEITDISARLIANKSSYKFKKSEIDAIAVALMTAKGAKENND